MCLALLEFVEEELIECVDCIHSVGLNFKNRVAHALLGYLKELLGQPKVKLHEEQLEVVGEELVQQLIHLLAYLFVLPQL